MDRGKAYEILQLDPNKPINEDILKSKYKKLAMQYHPDKNPTGEEQFKLITTAYKFLSEGEGIHVEGTDINEILRTFLSGGLCQGMNSIFGGGGGIQPSTNIFSNLGNLSDFIPHIKSKGTDIIVTKRISLSEFFFGTSVEITYEKQVNCDLCQNQWMKCNYCNGMGKKINRAVNNNILSVNAQTCENCMGNGRIRNCSNCIDGLIVKNCSKVVNILSNESGYLNDYLKQNIIFSADGNASNNNGRPGKLIIKLEIDSPDYTIKDNNVYYYKTINLKDSLLGISFIMNSFDESLFNVSSNKYIIKEGDGYKFDNKGLYNYMGIRGDLYIVFKILTPSKLNKEQRQAINQIL